MKCLSGALSIAVNDVKILGVERRLKGRDLSMYMFPFHCMPQRYWGCYSRPARCPFFPVVLNSTINSLRHPALKGIVGCTKSWGSCHSRNDHLHRILSWESRQMAANLLGRICSMLRGPPTVLLCDKQIQHLCGPLPTTYFYGSSLGGLNLSAGSQSCETLNYPADKPQVGKVNLSENAP